jgi:hypothetical protein
MLIKSFFRLALVMVFLSTSAFVKADQVVISGTIDSATGLFAVLTPVGTEFTGDLEHDGLHLYEALFNVGLFCFTTEAVGIPPTSQSCSPTSSIVAILPRDVVIPTPSDPIYDQLGSTFQRPRHRCSYG